MAIVYAPIVQELVQAIEKNEGWLKDFKDAVATAVQEAPDDIEGIRTLNDFLKFINDFLTWVPTETVDGRHVYRKLCLFYFIFGRPEAYQHQTSISPEDANKPLSWLSDWLVRYAQELGKFLDTPESLTEASLQTFKDSPSYHMDDYIEPHGGWKTFNEFFARNTKPGYRPIKDIANAEVIVAPADSTYQAMYPVDSNAIVQIKTLKWTISELLEQSKYANKFKDGIFMHSFLGPNDYHRLHTPVQGTVLEAKIIKGQVYLEVETKDGKLRPVRPIQPVVKKPFSRDLREFDAPDRAGYQFCQMRGLFVLDTALGIVAVLPIGMAQVSSVIPTAAVGQTLVKGEEIAYFQFGGSDIVLVFEAGSQVNITAKQGTHYLMGQQIATAKVPSL